MLRKLSRSHGACPVECHYDGFDKVTIEKPLNKKIAKIPFYIYDDTIHNYLKRLKTINDNEILMIPDLKKFIKI